MVEGIVGGAPGRTEAEELERKQHKKQGLADFHEGVRETDWSPPLRKM
jgi:hypothetical protein